jgi:transposase
MSRPGPRTVRKYSDEVKLAAVRLSQELGINVKTVAAAFAVHPFMLSERRKEVRDGVLRARRQPRVATPSRPVVRELAYLEELERKYAALQEEHDLLKKAIQFSSARKPTCSPSLTPRARRAEEPALDVARHAAEPGLGREHHLPSRWRPLVLSRHRDGSVLAPYPRLDAHPRAKRAVTCAVLALATRRRSPRGVIFHSDRGSKYMGAHFCTRAQQYGMLQSANVSGPDDNAHAESFFHTLKAELTRGVIFPTAHALRTPLQRYIRYYNTLRLHSSRHDRSPLAFERQAA